MKKLLLSTLAAFAMTSASAQTESPYILSEVEENTYAVTMTQDEISAAFNADWVSAAWNIGAALPKDYVMFENDEIKIAAAVDATPVYTANGKLSDMQKDFANYTGYINLGSTLAASDWTGDESIAEYDEVKANNQGYVVVTPKVAGTVKFGVYAGDNKRSIGIYKLATEAEKNEGEYGGWVAFNNFQNNGENGTENKAPAYVEGELEAGRQYLLIGGGNKNLTMHQISFVPNAVSAEPFILSEVEEGTFAVTMTQDEISAAFNADWVSAAWNIGAALPKDYVMFENDEIKIAAAVDATPVYTANGKLSDMQKDFANYTGYINLGSTLAASDWTGDESIAEYDEVKANNQGYVVVTPKVAGTVKFGVYAGDNKRSIGIYKLATEAEKNEGEYGGWVAFNNFQNNGENGTENKAPAYVEGSVEAGRQYLLIGGGNKNLTMHQISFASGNTAIDGISNMNNKKIAAIYTINGMRVNDLQKGLNIVKYTDGTSVKVLK